VRPLRRFGGGWRWGPLLALPRGTLEDYARAHGLHWVDGPSTAVADADRNFLRLEVLPLPQRRWPHAATALARSARMSAEADALLQDDEEALLRRHASEAGHTLPVDLLASSPPARRGRLLRLWI